MLKVVRRFAPRHVLAAFGAVAVLSLSGAIGFLRPSAASAAGVRPARWLVGRVPGLDAKAKRDLGMPALLRDGALQRFGGGGSGSEANR